MGLINIQFAVKDDQVYIIEANPRASRTVPFIAKAYGEPYVNHATKVMMGEAKLKDLPHNPELDGYAVKIPVFSYEKFPEVNKELGPEMKSTGEGIRFIPDLRIRSSARFTASGTCTSVNKTGGAASTHRNGRAGVVCVSLARPFVRWSAKFRPEANALDESWLSQRRSQPGFPAQRSWVGRLRGFRGD